MKCNSSSKIQIAYFQLSNIELNKNLIKEGIRFESKISNFQGFILVAEDILENDKMRYIQTHNTKSGC